MSARRCGFSCGISTHASLAGRDRPGNRRFAAYVLFQPTRPLRDATKRARILAPLLAISTHASLAGRDPGNGTPRSVAFSNFNPRVPCGTRPRGRKTPDRRSGISTHASLAGRDLRMGSSPLPISISTHASLAGRDASLPVRSPSSYNFNPRVPCGTRRFTSYSSSTAKLFQPTRPLRDATFCTSVSSYILAKFQPTRPLRDAT